MKKRWLICLLITRSLLAADGGFIGPIDPYQMALGKSQIYIHALENDNALSRQQIKDCDAAKLQCENSKKDFLGITKAEWALIGSFAGLGLGFYLGRR